MSKTLTAQAIRGGTLTFGASMVNRLLGVASTIYLVRTLTPEDFGLFSMAFAGIASFQLFSGLGTGHAVIQSTADPRELGIAGLSISSVMGLLMFVLVVLYSEEFALFFGSDQLPLIVLYLSPLVLSRSIVIVPGAFVQKNMHFGRRAVMTVTGDLVNICVSVLAAAVGQGLWSLVYGALSRSVVLLVLNWTLSNPKEWFRFALPQWSIVKSLLAFGMQSTIFGLLNYLTRGWHNLLVGRVLGATAVGYYSRAFVFSSIPLDQVVLALAAILFPAYARIQSDPERLQHGYLRSIRLLSLATFPAVIGLGAVADEFVHVVLGATWAPMITTLQALAVMNVFVFFPMATSPLYLATGSPRYNVGIAAIDAISTVAFTLIAVPYGIFWVACASAAARGLGAAYSLRAVSKVLPGVLPGLFRVIKAPLVGCVVMGLGIWAVRPAMQLLFAQPYSWGPFISLIVIGAGLYVGTVVLLDRSVIGVVLDVWKQSKLGGVRD